MSDFKNGEECIWKGQKYTYISLMPHDPLEHAVIYDGTFKEVRLRELLKPIVTITPIVIELLEQVACEMSNLIDEVNEHRGVSIEDNTIQIRSDYNSETLHKLKDLLRRLK